MSDDMICLTNYAGKMPVYNSTMLRVSQQDGGDLICGNYQLKQKRSL